MVGRREGRRANEPRVLNDGADLGSDGGDQLLVTGGERQTRTPIGQIKGFSELMEDDAGQMSERSRRYLGHVQTATGKPEWPG